MTKLNIPILDNSGDTSMTSVYMDDAATNGEITAFYNAVNGVTIGTLVKSYVTQSIDKDAGSLTPPTDKFARRENRFICHYSDTVTGKGYSFSIPCADLDLTTGDNVDMANAAAVSLKTAFEAVAVSEFGNPVTLNSIEYRGATY